MMSEIDRRTFLSLTAGALLTPVSFAGDSGIPPPIIPGWKNVVVVNALGGLGDPNRSPSDTGGQRPDDDWTHGSRVMREAAASGLTAVNVTLGYVAGEKEP